jgi:uncharacterized protein (TIGR02647 family)
MLSVIPRLTPELVAELNFLAHYDLDTMQEGIKVHKDADPAVIASAQRLYDKKLVTLPDGGYLTALGREVAEQLQSILTIMGGDQ